MRNSVIIIIIICMILSIKIFISGMDEMTSPGDFSAYYQGAYRLIHNPSQVYSWTRGLIGDYPIVDCMGYKYLPSFLLIILPFLLTSYQNALILFNFLQLLALFILHFLYIIY